MTELAERHCRPCEGGGAPYSAQEAQLLKEQRSRDGVLSKEGPYLRRAFKFKDFYRTMSFVNALAHIANIEDHHPALEVGYNYCRVQYPTHPLHGLSENDFICAAKVDAIPLT